MLARKKAGSRKRSERSTGRYSWEPSLAGETL